MFNQLAVEAGWVLDWNQIDPHVFAHARTVAIYRDPDGLDALLYPALVPALSVRSPSGWNKSWRSSPGPALHVRWMPWITSCTRRCSGEHTASPLTRRSVRHTRGRGYTTEGSGYEHSTYRHRRAE